MNFLASQFRTTPILNASYGIVRSDPSELTGQGISRSRPVIPEQREGEGEGEEKDDYPETEEDEEYEDPADEPVVKHVKRNVKSGLKSVMDKTGDAIMATVVPVVINRVIDAMLKRLVPTPGSKSKPRREGEVGEVVEGGARAIVDTANRDNVILPVTRVRNILRTLTPANRNQVKQQILLAARMR